MKLINLLVLLGLLTACQETITPPGQEESQSVEAEGTTTTGTTSPTVTPLTATLSPDLGGVIDVATVGNESSQNYLAILNSGYTGSTIQMLATTFGIQAKKVIHRFSMLSFKATPSQVNLMRSSPFVKSIQADVLIKMHLNTGVSQIRAKNVQDLGVDGSGVRVCVIDSGLNPHNNLAIPANEYDFVNDDTDADDEHGHGTAVTGIIASQHSGTLVLPGYKGVAPSVTLLVAKVFGASGTASGSVIASALDWCANNNAQVINMSLGHGGFATACDTDYTALMANTVAQLGISVVAASGNDGYANLISSPACGSKVISVGSVSKADMVSSFSNKGSILDLTAPGESITTTNSTGGFSAVSGTSAAAPFVTGVIALLKSLPESPSAETIKQALFSGAKDLGSAGKDDSYGYGRVDALAAYNLIKNISGGGTTGGTGGGTLSFSVSSPVLADDVRSTQYSSSQTQASKNCPSGHYLSDLEIQRSYWGVYRSITWMKLKCQSMQSLNTSQEMGVKRYAGSKNVKTNVCTNKRGITGINVVYDRYIKDFKFECSQLSYSSTTPGNVTVLDRKLNSSHTFGYKQWDDYEEEMRCPGNSIAVGLEVHAKKDKNEWAFTRLGLRCADIATTY
jgi:subtilisin family serine protease